ncbi:hypothetical protein CPB84DRAFT_1781731 [Gymnopilus junonius]|uniref:DUF6534 domain-containing protein n=1 Tax=Gymnopilus junonius TaxID=109634 RepID=A0A9P5NME0_GYMJU|nr:hypothetical protein CPB84DRAFT_1781731 [Gymnopilus junonius]
MSSVGSLLGAAYWGLLTATVLYGMTSVQAFIYFCNSKGDTLLVKSMVMFLWLLDTLHFVFIAQSLYFYVIDNFGDYGALEFLTWTILASIYVTNISDLVARWFFARRIYLFCRERNLKIVGRALVTAIIILSLLVFGCGYGFASRGFILKTYQRLNKISPLLYTSLGTAVIADTTIAVSLCILLFQSRIGFESNKMDSVLVVLMVFSINTGLLTSLCAIACFVTYTIWPQRLIYIGVYFTLSKLYVNALLASLNTRNRLRRSGDGIQTMSIPTGVLSPISFPVTGTHTMDLFEIEGANHKSTADTLP